MGLIPVISTWVQVNTSVFNCSTWHNWAFSSSDRRVLTLMHLSGPPRGVFSKGSIASGSLSSKAGRADDCDCYC